MPNARAKDKKQVNAWLRMDLYEELASIAQDEQISFSDVLIQFAQAGVTRYRQLQGGEIAAGCALDEIKKVLERARHGAPQKKRPNVRKR